MCRRLCPLESIFPQVCWCGKLHSTTGTGLHPDTSCRTKRMKFANDSQLPIPFVFHFALHICFSADLPNFFVFCRMPKPATTSAVTIPTPTLAIQMTGLTGKWILISLLFTLLCLRNYKYVLVFLECLFPPKLNHCQKRRCSHTTAWKLEVTVDFFF